MLGLAYTENKSFIRGQWDKSIVARFRQELDKPLAYFGLSGPEIRDFIDWGEYLGWKTVVEFLSGGSDREQQLRQINKLKTNMNLQRLAGSWELRKGSLEDIILNGYDIDGNQPKLLSIPESGAPKMKYDLHNWDFQSGIGYLGTLDIARRRLDAIRRCIELQRDHRFIFFITLNVRHTLREELSNFLVGRSFGSVEENSRKTLEWYSQRGSADQTDRYRLKAVLPLIVRDFAQNFSFDCNCYPPLYYEGYNNSYLIHFAFILTPSLSVLPSHSKQSMEEVIDFPFVEVIKGEFTLPELQHPNLDKSRAERLINSVLNPAT